MSRVGTKGHVSLDNLRVVTLLSPEIEEPTWYNELGKNDKTAE